VRGARTGCNAIIVGIVLVGCAGGCSRTASPPSKLLDGTRAEAPSVRLEARTPQIRTTVSIVSAPHARDDALAGQCIGAPPDRRPSGPVVVRVGVSGRSVTFRTAAARALVACDGSGRLRTGDAWLCGRAYGRLEHGRLHDPRLDLAGCATPTGDPIAFVWFEPGADTSYVAVQQPGYVEVYPVAAGLPVRVTTTSGISDKESSANFEVSEHDDGGAVLRSSAVEVRVAG
jgi:hypothetical protein